MNSWKNNGEQPIVTDKQQKAIDWALRFLQEDAINVQNLKDAKTMKRDRSLDDSMVELAKRHKPVNEIKNIDGMPLSEVVKQHLKVCIVDTAASDWRISVENFGIIESYIMENILKLMKENNQDPPSFEMNERYHGFRLILCETQFSLDFLRNCIENLNTPWEGANIELKSLMDLPAPRKIRILIPELNITKEDILEVLIRSNRTLPIINWKLIHVGETIKGRKLLQFRTDDESLVALESQKCKVNFSIRKLTAFVSKNKTIKKVLVDGDEFENEMDVDTAEPVVDLGLDVIEEFDELSCSDKDDTVIENKQSTPVGGSQEGAKL